MMIEETPNTTGIEIKDGVEFIIVNMNNTTENADETLRNSEHYKRLSEEYGGPYPHWEIITKKGLRF